jgi:hypothetical protein
MNITLIISQIFFNFTVALAIIVFGVLSSVVVFHLIMIVKELEKLSKNINYASIEVAERINDIIDRLSELPILSYLLKKRNKRRK